MKTEIGGQRLGSGTKENVNLKTYSRSTHDLSYLWRSSMSAGTLVPFMSEVALPGDNFEINLNCEVLTLPTIGPLFGSYKVQLDIFECPIRLYNGKLHMNLLNIGMDMSKILLPQIEMEADWKQLGTNDNDQINASSIYSYLNIRGLGRTTGQGAPDGLVHRNFNAIPYLAYWDIYKNYYANKQEERGFVIHTKGYNPTIKIDTAQIIVTTGNVTITNTSVAINGANIRGFILYYDPSLNEGATPNIYDLKLSITLTGQPPQEWHLTHLFKNITIRNVSPTDSRIESDSYNDIWVDTRNWGMGGSQLIVPIVEEGKILLQSFPLSNIDDMRIDILADIRAVIPFVINKTTRAPYGLGLKKENDKFAKLYSQEGLGIKTYQSDLFNNWISTEWITGVNGISAVTAVASAVSFTIDSLNLANKVYNMLNRIAISGGSYDDWLDAVYTHERAKSTENPMYRGSLIKELGFEEVISTADTSTDDNENQPLGTLAGRGRLTGKNKGGKINITVNEPSYIIGIVSLTPRIDYSQGNKWDVNLRTMNDLHKPALDEIGYQDLVTDQMAWFDTRAGNSIGANPTYKSAGKQPAWINYMTNVNQTRGNFADKNKEMFMTLNRRYERGAEGVLDLTTYIDPSKYNNIFAQTSLDSQNFWVQISNQITARRKMSAKVIPNL